MSKEQRNETGSTPASVRSNDQVADKKRAGELSEEELRKVSGGVKGESNEDNHKDLGF